MRKLKCARCGHEWTWSWIRWVMSSPFHHFSFRKGKDFRKTKCPNCGVKSWISSTRTKG